jgi:5-methylcytosine-specific restriction protein A
MPTRPEVHRPEGWRPPAQADAERRAAYDQTKARHYTKRRWYHLRRAYLASHPLCECGCGHVATVVDHKRPHGGDDALLYAWDNLQAMTKPCHDRKTAGRDGGFGNRRASPPAAGRHP